MNVKIYNIVGIKCKDPVMPGRLYLSEEGDLTKELKRAKLVPKEKLDEAVKEVRIFSSDVFTQEVVPFYS